MYTIGDKGGLPIDQNPSIPFRTLDLRGTQPKIMMEQRSQFPAFQRQGNDVFNSDADHLLLRNALYINAAACCKQKRDAQSFSCRPNVSQGHFLMADTQADSDRSA